MSPFSGQILLHLEMTSNDLFLTVTFPFNKLDFILFSCEKPFPVLIQSNVEYFSVVFVVAQRA